MQSIGVARCQSCQAVVNLNWSTCLVCRGSLDAQGESERNQSGESSLQGPSSPVPGSLAKLRTGDTIAWDSPLFGRLTGELLAVHEDGQIDVFHPLREGIARIPLLWVRQKE